MLDIEFAQLSDPGRVRDHNEDSLGYVAPDSPAQVRSHGWLFVLADGVGGQALGEVASKAAVEAMTSGFRRSGGHESHFTLMPRLVQAANTHVFETGMAAGPAGRSMATTIVTCALKFDRAVVAHVGDSRCYLIRRGQAQQLTNDHTVVNEQIRLGILRSGETNGLHTKHLLSRSLGNNMFVGVECSEHHVHAGDVLLLCSDGLHGALSGGDMAGIVRASEDLEGAATRLIAAANERDGADNVSVQLIRVRDVERVGMYRGRPYKLR